MINIFDKREIMILLIHLPLINLKMIKVDITENQE